MGGWKYLGTGKTVNLPTEPFTELFVWQSRDDAPSASSSSTFVYTVPKAIIPSTGRILIDNGYGQNTSSMARVCINVSATAVTAVNYSNSSANTQVAVYYR